MNSILSVLFFILELLQKYLPLDENDLNAWFVVKDSLISEQEKLRK